ncbi:MAG TPA: UbiA family prenyltransferase [Candidatus Dormibacteraeota bacterium]|nr:UbiA family prenyltransferase [Candidatus Dormibacteraeota bacterium]
MSKRKRGPRPPAEDPSDDDTAKDDMVHVTPDLLAGGPDIFASRKSAEPAEPVVDPPAETTDATPEPPPAPFEPTEASTTPTPEEPAAPAPPSAPPPPPYVAATPYPARPRRGSSSAALGVVLVVLGIFALAIALTGYDLSENGWPLFILIPGLTLLVAGFISFGSVATVPGGIVTMLGLVLSVTNSTGHWAVLAYAWSLVVPFGVGLGIYLQAFRDRDQRGLHTGRTLLFIGFMIFLIGFVLFESILGISGRDTFGPVSKAALPVLLIIVGVILFYRSVQASRRA